MPPVPVGSDLIEELPHLPSGVVLIDIQNAGDSGFDVIEAVSRAKLACPIIGMTNIADVHIAVACIRRGAVDVLVKPIDPDMLTSAMAGARAILAERTVVFERAESDRRRLGRLTPRELSILEFVTDGLCNKAIAASLRSASALWKVTAQRSQTSSRFQTPRPRLHCSPATGQRFRDMQPASWRRPERDECQCSLKRDTASIR